MDNQENKRSKFTVAVAAALAVAVLVAAYFIYYNNANNTDYLTSTGVIEATEVNLSPRISGRIEWLCCEEGDKVEALTPAIRLESSELEARLEEGKAAAASAEEGLKEAKTSLDSAAIAKQAAAFEAVAFGGEVERTAALRDESLKNLDRARALSENGFIPRKDLDAATAEFEADAALFASAAARSKAAVERLKSSDVDIELAKVRISSARAAVKQATAQVKVLNALLSDARVSSPINGVVSYKAFETGEYVDAGGAVYTVYDLTDIWARVDIEETAIEKFGLGARVEVRTPSMPDRVYKAKVTEIGEVAGFATQRDVTRGRPDIKTFRVKAAIEAPNGLLKPGMTVEVRIYFTGAGG